MDDIQRTHEHAAGDAFVDWYNRENGKQFVYDERPREAPDLRYVDAGDILDVEITNAYYDKRDAEMQWKSARKEPDAPIRWSGTNFDQALVEQINARLTDKCSKDYGRNCILVVNTLPALTTADEMEKMLPQITIPNKNPFAGIYLTGNFPDSSSSQGGFRCWHLEKRNGC